MATVQTDSAIAFIDGRGLVNVTTALKDGLMWVYYPVNITDGAILNRWQRISDIIVNGEVVPVSNLTVTAFFVEGVGLTVIYTALTTAGDIWLNKPTNSVNDLFENVWSKLPTIG